MWGINVCNLSTAQVSVDIGYLEPSLHYNRLEMAKTSERSEHLSLNFRDFLGLDVILTSKVRD